MNLNPRHTCIRCTGSGADSVGKPAQIPKSARHAEVFGGPIALLRDGDLITIDAVKGELSVSLSDEDLAARKADWPGPKPTQYASGAIWKFAKLAGGARWGAVTHPGAREERHVYMDQ